MSEPQAVNDADSTPRRLLIRWANEQDSWVRSLVSEVLATGQEPDESFVDALFDSFMIEKGFSEDAFTPVPELELAEGTQAEDQVLQLQSIDDVQGVNALVPGHILDFDPALTVLFGQNGSGKTGYARILKRVAAVRTAGDILPNALVTDPQPSPSALLKYTLGGDAADIRWANESGLSPLTRLSIFDNDCVTLHVDSELNYVYTPADLALFAHVSTGIRKVQERIGAAVTARQTSRNPLLTSIPRGTKVYGVIETLGAATEISDLDELADVPEGSDALQLRLQEEVSALRGNSLDALVANARTDHRGLARLGAVATTLSNFSTVAYNESVIALQAAQTEWRRYRAELFAPDELPGPVDDDWQTFVVAAESYREHLGLHEYPQAGDLCLYCRQELGAEALSLVQRYKTFLDETVASRLRDAQDRVTRLRMTVGEADLVAADLFVGERSGQDQVPTWVAQAAWLLTEVRAGLTACEAGNLATAFDAAKATEAVQQISQSAAQAEAAHATLVEQRDNRVQALADKQNELNELTGRLELRRQLEDVKGLVRRAKEAARLDQLSKSISSRTLRQLTDQSKIASEDLVNRSFETLFEEECHALRAPRVLLHFQGRGGKAERRKAVAHYKPSAILSEGEQKVLALADFLAESRMRGNTAPIIFDDPVTSLDYRRHREVAQRILRLAASHQVIVFTHNVMFASELLAGRNRKQLRCRFYEVRDDGVAKGVLAPDVEPRLDTPKDIGARVNVKLETAAHADPSVQDALISETYDLIRAWCEAFVEQEMLGNVTQRYRANIMMGELSKIKSGMLESTTTQVGELFDKACRCMTGHSQPAEYLSVKPTLAEVKADWGAAQAMRKAYLSA